MIRALDTTRSALVAQRVRMDVIAGNMANAFTPAQDDGAIAPYQRRVVIVASGDGVGGPGVHVTEIRRDDRPPRMEHDPGHPYAIQEGPWAGYVAYPNVDPTMEYIDGMVAARAYELNLAMMNLTRGMLQQAVQLLA
jgi:flagellar basal-body rod protein FlgC